MSNKFLFILSTAFISVGFQVSLGLMSSLYASENKEDVSTTSLLILQLSVCLGCIFCHRFVRIKSPKKVMLVSAAVLSLFVLFAGIGNEIVFYIFSVLGGFANGIFSLAFLSYLNLICTDKNRSVFINLTFASHVLGNLITFSSIRMIMPYCDTGTILLLLFGLIAIGIYVTLKVADIPAINVNEKLLGSSNITNFRSHLFFLLSISMLIGFMMGLNFSLIPIKVTNLLGKEVWTEICLINTIIFFVLMLVFCKYKIVSKIGIGLSGIIISLSMILYLNAENYWQFVVMEITLTFGVAFYWGSVIQITNSLFKQYFDYVNGPRNAIIFLSSALGISLQFFYSDFLLELISFFIGIFGLVGGIYLSYQVLSKKESCHDIDDEYEVILE